MMETGSMAAKLFLLSLALVLSARAATAQVAPQCGQEDVFAFISTGLPRECGTNILNVLQLGTSDLTPSEGQQAVSDVCTPSCVGTLVNYLRDTCFDPVQAFDYELWCFQVDDAEVGPFCRYALGDIFNATIFANTAACFGQPGVCVQDCRNTLVEIKSQIGCCYQTLYNNSAYLSGLVERGFITQFQSSGLLALANPAGNSVWDMCEVESPARCESNPAVDATTMTTTSSQSTTMTNGERAVEMNVFVPFFYY